MLIGAGWGKFKSTARASFAVAPATRSACASKTTVSHPHPPSAIGRLSSRSRSICLMIIVSSAINRLRKNASRCSIEPSPLAGIRRQRGRFSFGPAPESHWRNGSQLAGKRIDYLYRARSRFKHEIPWHRSVGYRGPKAEYPTPRNSSLENSCVYAWLQCFDDPLSPLTFAARRNACL